MLVVPRGYFVLLAACALSWACRGQSPQPPPPSAMPQPPSATSAADADPADDNIPAPPIRSAEALAALLPSDGIGCAPGTRWIRVSADGRPQANGASVAQCRGEFADFIVPRVTIPVNYNGPWFQPNLIEQAHTGVPTGVRPWRDFDPRQESQRLAYLLAPRNYAFASEPGAESDAPAHGRQRLLGCDRWNGAD